MVVFFFDTALAFKASTTENFHRGLKVLNYLLNLVLVDNFIRNYCTGGSQTGPNLEV